MRKYVLILLSLLLPVAAFTAADRVLDTGVLKFKEMVSAPASPSAGYVNTYGLTDGYRYFLDSTGTQRRILDIASFGTNGQLFRTTGSTIGLTTSTFPSTNSAGDTFYGSGSNAWGALSIGTANQLYGVNNAGTAPEYKAVTATAAGALTAAGAIRSNTSLVLEDPGAGSNTVTIQSATPSGSYTLKLPVADGTNGQALKTDGLGQLSFGDAGGAGGAGINLITLDTAGNNWAISKGTNFDLEASIGDWLAYADAAGTDPVDMTGGSPSTTCARDTSTEINGTASLKMDLGSGSSRQGEGCSILVNVPSAYRGKNVALTFPFTTSGTMVQDDLKLAAYDVTNGARIDIFTKGRILGASGQALGVLSIPSNAAQIRVGVHVARTTTGALSLVGDDFQVSPQIPAAGLNGSNWRIETITIPSSPWGTVTNYLYRWREIGDSIEVDGWFESGSLGVSAAYLPLPPGKNINFSTTGTSQRNRVGVFTQISSGSSVAVNIVSGGQIPIFTDGTNADRVFIGADSASGSFTKENGNARYASGTFFHFNFTVPIAGQSANITSSESSTFWISSYLANGTRVTSTPTKLGEYRSFLRQAGARTFTETNGAPAADPSVANGMTLYKGNAFSSADTNNNPTRYDIFVGKNKNVTPYFHQSAGRTGYVGVDSATPTSGVDVGFTWNYDPTTGIFSIAGYRPNGSTTVHYTGFDQGGDYASSPIYFDLKVSENALAVTADAPSPRYTSRVNGSTGAIISRGRVGSLFSGTCSHPSTGRLDCTFVTGLFATTPACGCTGESSVYCYTENQGTTGVRFRTLTDGNSNTDANLSVWCEEQF